MKPTRIPIFPLDVVLFPGALLPLHIFEPRYKLMVRRCLNSKEEFGVILVREKGIASVGCTARIVRVLHQYPGGRMDILTRGESLFHAASVLEGKPYFEAEVEYLADAPETGLGASEELEGLFEQSHWLIFGRPPKTLAREPGRSLAFQMAAALPLELEEKQALLEIRQEGERQRHLAERLNDWVPQLVHLNEMRQRARGNGHAVN